MHQTEKKDWWITVIGLFLVVYISYRYAVPVKYMHLYYMGYIPFSLFFLGGFLYKKKKKEKAWPYLIFIIIIGSWLCLDHIMKIK